MNMEYISYSAHVISTKVSVHTHLENIDKEYLLL